MIGVGAIVIPRRLAASVVLGLLSACAEVNRPIGHLSALAEAGAAGEGTAGAPASSCASLGRCGGDLLRADADGLGKTQWIAKSTQACQESLPLPEPFDACAAFSVSADSRVTGMVEYPAVPIESARIELSGPGADGSAPLSVRLQAASPESMFFSAACRARWAVPLGCPELGRRIVEELNVVANVAGLRCADDDQGGCVCDYQVEEVNSLAYAWTASDGLISLVDVSFAPGPATPIDYCQSGDTLTFTGHDGGRLFGHAPSTVQLLGLRTLELHPPSCTDGVQDGGELGIDCGGTCPSGCGSCDDGLRSVNEEAVDCGGACPDACFCFNGSQDPWEEGPDCGGACALPCSCTNGKQDADEDGIDCGGKCNRRFSDNVAIPCPSP